MVLPATAVVSGQILPVDVTAEMMGTSVEDLRRKPKPVQSWQIGRQVKFINLVPVDSNAEGIVGILYQIGIQGAPGRGVMQIG